MFCFIPYRIIILLWKWILCCSFREYVFKFNGNNKCFDKSLINLLGCRFSLTFNRKNKRRNRIIDESSFKMDK